MPFFGPGDPEDLIKEEEEKQKNPGNSIWGIYGPPRPPASAVEQHASSGQTGGFPVNPDVNQTKELSRDDLIAAYQAGKLSVGEFKDRLAAMHYSPKDVALIVSTSDKTKHIDAATLTKAYAIGKLDKAGLTKQLTDAGLTGQELQVMLDLADDSKTDESRVDAGKDKISEGNVLKLYGDGNLDRGMAKTRLMKEQGYSDEDAEILLRGATPKPKSSAGGGSTEAPTPDRHGTAAAPTYESRPNTKGRLMGQARGDNIHPQAGAKMGDFRTAFAANIKANAGGLTTPAKMWAMDNQDMFLPDYLNSGAFTMGAGQIQALYEGFKGSRQRSGAAGGEVSSRQV